jgi:hypothetical protein
MSRPTSVAPGTLLGLALGGVLAGHTLTYGLLQPDAHRRTELLASTGHAYLHTANDIGVAAVVLALAVVFLGGVLGNPDVSPQQLVRRLVGFQVSAFLGMEVVERVVARASFADLGGVVLVGVGAQLIVALAIGGVVALLVRAGRAVTGSPREVVAARPALTLDPPTLHHLRSRDVFGHALERAPPVPSA